MVPQHVWVGYRQRSPSLRDPRVLQKTPKIDNIGGAVCVTFRTHSMVSCDTDDTSKVVEEADQIVQSGIKTHGLWVVRCILVLDKVCCREIQDGTCLLTEGSIVR